MNDRIKKMTSVILLIFAMFTAVLILYSMTGYEHNYPEHSSYNAEKDGIKALYSLTREMGFQPERFHYPAKFLKEQDVMLLYRPEENLFNETAEQQSIKEWVLAGKTLILIPNENTLRTLWIFNWISDLKQWHEITPVGGITITWYGMGSGTVCVLDRSERFLNSSLKDSDASVAFIRALERIGNRKIYFNEYYHHLQKPAPGIWKLIGMTGQLIVIQILLVLLLVVLRGWKPFGRTRDETQWMKRPENETLKALTGLYIRMKAYPLVLSNYYGTFVQKYHRFLHVKSPLQEKAAAVLSQCERYMEKEKEKGSIRKRELYHLMHQLENIEDEMKKGMRRAWK